MKKLNFLNTFFYLYPSLFYSLFFLLGISFFLYKNVLLLCFFLFIWNKKKIFIAIFMFIISNIYCNYFFSDIKKITIPIQGTSLYKIESVKEIYNFTNRYYLYLGTVKKFESGNLTYSNIQASVSSKKFYSPLFIYKIDGILTPDENYSFYIKTKKDWQKQLACWNLSKIRFDLKKKFYNYLVNTIKDENCVNFLHTLTTGDNTHKFLSFSFAKIGLQHVLAISGFHFGIFTLFFSFILKLLFPRNYVIFFLLILVNFYFLFLGPLISVQRSYLMIQMALFAQIANRKYLALNALGLSMLIILITNPLSFKNIGFQLSYLCTFAILLIYPIIDAITSKFFKKRSLEEINELNLISKIFLKIFDFIREGIFLSISVNFFILPVILFYFHKFAILSFIYNLFIPFLVGISLMLIIIGFIFYFLPPLSFLINSMNTFFTKVILKMITYPPDQLGFYIRSKDISIEFVIIYLAFISLFFVFFREYLKKQQLPEYCNFL